jgi:ABC-type transporter Mla maintaining outer membrane lipid asymmetry permease subunit MlaE
VYNVVALLLAIQERSSAAFTSEIGNVNAGEEVDQVPV